MTFFSTLEARCKSHSTLLCVGLDPHTSELGDDASAANAERFCLSLISQTKEFAAAFKPNEAFFEALGAEGLLALERVVQAIKKEGVPCVLDCKRGDIATTAEAYADAAFEVIKADAVTVHPYMGWDSVLPFAKRGGVFVLTKTSNASANDFQTLVLNSGETVYERVAKTCVGWNEMEGPAKGAIGMVVGATDPEALLKVRKVAPELWMLVPGVGAQGGDADAVVGAGLRISDGLGILVNVSRGISRAKDPAAAARIYRDQLNAARALAMAPPLMSSSASASKKVKTDNTQLAPYQEKFFALAIRCGVLKFGMFTLKSGRQSPYFFNAGLFNTGSAAAELAGCYAQAVVDSKIEYDVLFGPAYKGIPLAATVAAELYNRHGLDVAYCYNRKEEKDHGEGGLLVGAKVGKGTRVLILDDVITAGTAVRESLKLVNAVGGQVVGLVVAIDRKEVVAEGGSLSAVDSVVKEFGFPVISIVSLDHLLLYCEKSSESVGGKVVLDSVNEYRTKYGSA